MGGTCRATGKRCFTSKKRARKGMRRLPDSLRIYRCPECDFYHLTKERKMDPEHHDPSNMERFAAMVGTGTDAHAAAAMINGENDSEAVNRITGILAEHGAPWDLARAKARNIVSILDTLEPEADRVAQLGSSLLRDDAVLATVVHEVARACIREWERSEVEASHD